MIAIVYDNYSNGVFQLPGQPEYKIIYHHRNFAIQIKILFLVSSNPLVAGTMYVLLIFPRISSPLIHLPGSFALVYLWDQTSESIISIKKKV